MQKFYFFGIEKGIKRLFIDERFQEAFQENRSLDDKNVWQGSDQRKWVNARSGNQLKESKNATYSVGFDWFNAVNHGSHSVGVVSIRCEDISHVHVGKAWNNTPIMLIPGPHEPKILQTYFTLIAKEIEKLRSTGIRISIGKETFLHRPVWGLIHADGKAIEKLMLFNGSAATYSCRFCRMPSINFSLTGAGKTHKRMMGYEKEVSHQIVTPLLETEGEGQVVSYKVELDREKEATRKLHNKHFKKRARIVQNACDTGVEYGKLSQNLGVSGDCGIFDIVPTLHRVNCYPLPFYHLIALGLVKQFITYLYKEGTDKFAIRLKDKLAALETNFVINCELGRPYTELSKCGLYVIEEIVRFMEIFSVVLFNDQVTLGNAHLTSEAKKAWGYLRRGLSFYMNPESDVADSQARLKARQELLEFGKTCEKVCMHTEWYIVNCCDEYSKILLQEMPTLCSQNLHIMLCRLDDQEEKLGKGVIQNELYVERSLNIFKSTVTGSVDPTRSGVRKYLDYARCRELISETGDDYLNIDDDIRLDNTKDDLSKLLFKGRLPTEEEKKITQDALGPGLRLQESDIWVHTGASVCRKYTSSEFRSMQHVREKNRNSTFVIVREGDGKMNLARIRFFVRVNTGPKTHRLAVCDVVKPPQKICDIDTGNLLFIEQSANADETLFARTKVPMDLEKLVCPTCYWATPLTEPGIGSLSSKFIYYFIPNNPHLDFSQFEDPRASNQSPGSEDSQGGELRSATTNQA